MDASTGFNTGRKIVRISPVLRIIIKEMDSLLTGVTKDEVIKAVIIWPLKLISIPFCIFISSAPIPFNRKKKKVSSRMMICILC